MTSSLATEKNRMKRRDMKRSKKRTGMRVDDSARKLARIKSNIVRVNREMFLRFYV